jgi:hypothetical protein
MCVRNPLGLKKYYISLTELLREDEGGTHLGNFLGQSSHWCIFDFFFFDGLLEELVGGVDEEHCVSGFELEYNPEWWIEADDSDSGVVRAGLLDCSVARSACASRALLREGCDQPELLRMGMGDGGCDCIARFKI